MNKLIENFTDEKTGERIQRCPIPDKWKAIIEKSLNVHQQKLNHFFALSQQLATVHTQWIETQKQSKTTSEHVVKTMRNACRLLKLSENEPWTYNLVLRCFELRNPPSGILPTPTAMPTVPKSPEEVSSSLETVCDKCLSSEVHEVVNGEKVCPK